MAAEGPGMHLVTVPDENQIETHYFIQPQNTFYLRARHHPDYLNDPDVRDIEIKFTDGSTLSFLGKAGE
jgi:hypothetical protein